MQYTLQNNIGKAKYVVNFYDGSAQHSDGSPFWGVRIFSNLRARNQFIAELKRQGYKEK